MAKFSALTCLPPQAKKAKEQQEEEEEGDLDPDMMALMGFGGFGTSSKK